MEGGINVAKKKRKKRNLDIHAKDWHHCFFQKRHWKIGWAKVLREQPYCGASIPKNTLHRFIHENVHDVPVADGKSCKIAVMVINNWLEAGYISLDDTVEQKLRTLICIFNKMSPATANVLRKQLEIVCNYTKQPP